MNRVLISLKDQAAPSPRGGARGPTRRHLQLPTPPAEQTGTGGSSLPAPRRASARGEPRTLTDGKAQNRDRWQQSPGPGQDERPTGATHTYGRQGLEARQTKNHMIKKCNVWK